MRQPLPLIEMNEGAGGFSRGLMAKYPAPEPGSSGANQGDVSEFLNKFSS